MDILIKIVQVILALSILVLVHEFGHFFFARLFKIRVEKFYLFFDAWFSIFKYKPKGSDTEYGIGWLPLGGYCKIAGMIDESMDKEALKQEPKPWEFRSKPAWQRFLVMFGGVFFNFILAVIIYSGTLFAWGDEYIENRNAIYGVECNQVALEIGFKNGDRIIAFNDISVLNSSVNELQIDLARNQAETATIIRGGDTLTIDIPQSYMPAILSTPGMFNIRFPFIVQSIPDTSHNFNSGLLPGDRVVAIDSIQSLAYQDIVNLLQSKKESTALFTIQRGDLIIEKELSIDYKGNIGIILDNDITKLFDITTRDYSLIQSIPAGFNKTIVTIRNYFKELALIFSPKTEAYKSVGSFITIGKIFPSTWNWQIFWNITAFLSVMLAVLNLLPIPALDGGHILFLIYEIITRRKPNDKFMEYAQLAGMLLLFTLMFFAFGNDIYRLFK
jgi:regulator of sigma E protease